MANSIASAKRYINNDAELEKIYKEYSYTAMWEKENKAVGARTVAYRKLAFGSSVLGDYDRETGYTRTDMTVTWVEKTLSLDKGNALKLDRMDGEEAQSLNLVQAYKDFKRKIEIPEVDKSRFAKVVATSNITKKTETLTDANIETAVDTAIDSLLQQGIKEDVTMHIAVSKARLLKNALKKKGVIVLDKYTGDVNTAIGTYGDSLKVTVVEVPDAIIGTLVDFIVAPNAAIACMVKSKDNEYFDKIAGYGGRMSELDVGIYHDCWVEPQAEPSVYVHVHTA